MSIVSSKPDLSSKWCHNESHRVSNHRHRECLLSRLFKQTTKENIEAPRHWQSCEGNLHVESPHKGPVTGKWFHLMTSSWLCLLLMSCYMLYRVILDTDLTIATTRIATNCSCTSLANTIATTRCPEVELTKILFPLKWVELQKKIYSWKGLHLEGKTWFSSVWGNVAAHILNACQPSASSVDGSLPYASAVYLSFYLC